MFDEFARFDRWMGVGDGSVAGAVFLGGFAAVDEGVGVDLGEVPGGCAGVGVAARGVCGFATKGNTFKVPIISRMRTAHTHPTLFPHQPHGTRTTTPAFVAIVGVLED